MKELKSIEFIFENCEHMEFPRNVIGRFEISDIQNVISRIASNSISKYQEANHFYIEIFKEGDTTYHPFGIDDKKIPTKFKRILLANDITQIIIHYDDDIIETYLVDYKEESDDLGAINLNQTTQLSSLGNLYIVISEILKFDEIFPSNEINDEEYMNYLYECYDIGIEEEPIHSYTMDDLPEFYRYVYLSDDQNQSLAMRTFDEFGKSRFVYENGHNEILIPTSWQYPTSKIDKFIKHENKNRTLFTPYQMFKKDLVNMLILYHGNQTHINQITTEIIEDALKNKISPKKIAIKIINKEKEK